MLNLTLQHFGISGRVFQIRDTHTGENYAFADIADEVGVEEAQSKVFCEKGYQVREGENWIDSDQFNDLIFDSVDLVHFPEATQQHAVEILKACGFGDAEEALGDKLCTQLRKFTGKVRHLEIQLEGMLSPLDLTPLYHEVDLWLSRKGCWLEPRDGIPEDFLRTHRIFMGAERIPYDRKGGHNDG